MNYKIDIAGTSIALEIVDENITITNKIEYDMQMHFRNTDADAFQKYGRRCISEIRTQMLLLTQVATCSSLSIG